MKRSLKDGLKTSVGKEAKAKAPQAAAFKDRFAAADRVLQNAAKPSRLDAKVEPAPLVLRDTFTFPAEDYALFERLSDRAMGLRLKTTKSALVRAGLRQLMALSDAHLGRLLKEAVPLKPGRKS